MLKKIGYKLILSYLVVILVLFFTFTTVYNRYYRSYNVEQLEEKLQAESFALSQTLSYTLTELSAEELENLAARFKEATEARVTVIDPDGMVLAETDTDREDMDNHLDRSEFQQALRTGEGIEIRYSDTLDEDFLYVAREVRYEDELLAYVRTSISMEEAQTIPLQLRYLERGSMLFAAFVSLLVGLAFSRNLSRPVAEMTDAVKEIENGRFDVRVYPRTSDEISDLGKSINRMAEKLRQNMDRVKRVKGELEEILNHLNTAVVYLDNRGNVRLLNERAVYLFGYTADEAVGHHHLQVIRDYKFDKTFRKSLEKNRVQSVELERYAPELQFLETVCIPVIDEEGTKSVVVSMHDTTRLKMAEKIRTEFVANASHELKTPLATIKGFTETLLDGAINDPETAARFVGIIDAEATRLNRISEDLLSLAKLESRSISLNLSGVAISKVIDEAVKKYDDAIKKERLTVKTDIPGDLLLVKGDREWLVQVVSNLLENSIKYIGEGKNIWIKAVKDGCFVRVEVMDDGIGIPGKEKHRVFERFYRVDKGRSRESGGTGLGLSIVKHIIDAHEGEVGIDDRCGGGTIVWFRVPAATKVEG